tara:strand:+ start:329 stop:604 length:276 start_codon:yes stop_codon:yes gene_type:complete
MEKNTTTKQNRDEWFDTPKKEPKIKLSFDGCYNYSKLKKEGLVDDSSKKEEKDLHQKMYEIATSKYNPFSVGGSENIHDFDSTGGSEKIQG